MTEVSDLLDEFENDNAVRRKKWARRTAHCGNGHEWTEANTLWTRDSRGYLRRVCRACADARRRKWKQLHPDWRMRISKPVPRKRALRKDDLPMLLLSLPG